MLHTNLDKDSSTKTQNKLSDLFPCSDYTSQELQGHTDLQKMHFNSESLLLVEVSNLDAKFCHQCFASALFWL